MIWTLFGCLACLAIGIMVGWVACRIKMHVTPDERRRRRQRGAAVPQALPAIPKPKPTTPAVKPFDKKDRSTWPIVEAEAIPELRKTSAGGAVNAKQQPKTTTRVATLQSRLAYATELLDMHGLGTELREGIQELEETG